MPQFNDVQLLVALYHATDGPNWKNNTNWLSDTPLEEWSGVITDNTGRVTILSLNWNQLAGPIPPHLGNLANLEWLSISGNQLSGEIPAELGSLSNLEWLGISENQLNGEIPPWLGSLSNLTGMWLDANQLSGCVPGSLEDQLDFAISDLGDLPFC